MKLSRPVIEVAIAVVIAIIVLLFQPGVAVGGILALILLAVVGVSVTVERRRRLRAPRRRSSGVRRPPNRGVRPRR